jgi:hypothetical protein
VGSYAVVRISSIALSDYQKVGNIALFFILFGITFTLTNHLVRQYIAMSFALLSVSFAMQKRILLAGLLSVVAVGIHNMTIIYFVISISAVFIGSRIRSAQLAGVLLAAGFGVAIGLAIPYLSGSVAKLSAESLYFKDDGSVSYFIRAGDCFLWLSATIMFFANSKRGYEYTKIIYAMMLLYTSIYWFTISIGYSPLLSLRLYFMLDYARWCSMFVLVCTPAWGALRGYATALMIAIGLVYVQARISVSPFVYELDVIDLAIGVFRKG